MQIIAINKPENDRLPSIMAEMERRGAPAIKAVWMAAYNAWVALEGSHRLAAAQALGVTPEIEEVEYEDLDAFEGMDLDCYGREPREALTDLCDSAWERCNLAYTF